MKTEQELLQQKEQFTIWMASHPHGTIIYPVDAFYAGIAIGRRHGLSEAAKVADDRADELREMKGKPAAITNSLMISMLIRQLAEREEKS